MAEPTKEQLQRAALYRLFRAADALNLYGIVRGQHHDVSEFRDAIRFAAENAPDDTETRELLEVLRKRGAFIEGERVRHEPTEGPFEVQDYDGEWAMIGSPADRGHFIMKVVDWDEDVRGRLIETEPPGTRSAEENGANVRLAVASRTLYDAVKDIVSTHATTTERRERLARLVHFIQTGQGSVD